MENEDQKNKSVIKKVDVLAKFDPQREKGLIVRGLRETELKKVILLVDENKHVHRLYDEEFNDVFGNKIKLVHFNSPKDAFEYLLSSKVNLIISGIFFSELSGFDFLQACKTLYPKLPFIMNSTIDYPKNYSVEKLPDAFIVFSADLSELLATIRKLLNSSISTEDYKMETGDSDTLYHAGNAYSKLGMYKEAIESYQKVLRIKPDYADAHYHLGFPYASLGMYKEAISAYQEAIRIKPDFENAHYALGCTYADLRMHKKAIPAYQEAIRINPSSAYFCSLGTAYAFSEMYEEAISAYQRAISIRPEVAIFHYSLGAVYLKIGEKSKALEEYQLLKSFDSELAAKLFDIIYE